MSANMSEDEIQDLFREMRDEPVPADSLARVRTNVAERTRRASRWSIAKWALACSAVIVAGMLVQSGAFVQKAVHVSLSSSQSERPLPLLPAREPLRPAIRRVRRRRKPEPPVQTVSIRIETPDPDVVIWLVGE